MKQFKLTMSVALACVLLSRSAAAQCTSNYLHNPGFELPVQTANGNNYPVALADWILLSGTANLVKTNGVTDYYGGPNNASDGVQYLDIVNASGTITQNFTTTCPSIFTFRGDFSSRETGTSWTARIDIVDAANVVVASSTVYNFTTADADNALPGGPDAVWHTLNGSTPLLPAGNYSYRFFLNDYGNFDNAFLCIESGCVLPVKLTSFTAMPGNNCQPTVQWKVSEEINVKQYELQASGNGSNFETVATIASGNAVNGRTYSAIAARLPGAIAFYRLKITGNDNRYEYSDIIRFKNNCKENGTSMAVYPNPVRDKLSIHMPGSKPITVSVTTAQGQKMTQLVLVNGVTGLDVSSYPAGIYFISEINAGGAKVNTTKFVKY